MYIELNHFTINKYRINVYRIESFYDDHFGPVLAD